MHNVDVQPFTIYGENDRYNIYSLYSDRESMAAFLRETIFTSGDRKVEVILMSRLSRGALNSRDAVFTGSLYSFSATSCAKLLFS